MALPPYQTEKPLWEAIRERAARRAAQRRAEEMGPPLPNHLLGPLPNTPPIFPEGSPQNPMQLSTMEVRGTPPPQVAANKPAATATPSGPAEMAPPPSPDTPGSPSIFDNPEAVSAVLGMGDRNRQLAYAEEMRRMASPEGRYVSGGRVYTAASPLEHIGVGYQRYKGHREADRLGKEQTAAKQRIIDMLRGKREEPENRRVGFM